eukprot:gene5168-24105_t
MGPACSTLDLQPTGPTGDLRLPNVSTWGMTVLPKGAGDQEWHGLYAEMTRGCGLTSWETNSQIAHATAPTPAGPWTRQDTVLGVWAHTPSAAVARDGTIVLFHLGSGVGGGALPGSREYNATCTTGRSPCGTHPQHHCNKTEPGRAAAAAAVEAPAPPPPPLYSRSTSPRAAARGTAASAAGTGTTTGTSTVSFHVSHNGAAGPWEKTTASITDSSGLVKGGLKGAAADNFAFDTPFAHPNGTLYVVTAGNAILRAEDWRGPYDVVIATGACGPGEDNYVWVDHRGNFHCLYHRGPFWNLTAQGGHAFSTDAFTWHVSKDPAYPAEVRYTDGSVGQYGKRERPHLVFDATTRQPTHLTNGVCLNGDWALCNNNPYPGFFDYTFTTVAPLKTPE